MAGKNTFLDLDDKEVPELEIEEEDKDKELPDKDDKGGKKKPSDDDGEEEEEFEEEEPRGKKKSDDGEEEEEEEGESDKERADRLAAELADVRDANAKLSKEMHDMTIGQLTNEQKSLDGLVKEFDDRIKATRDALVKAEEDEDKPAIARLRNQIDELKEHKAKCEGLSKEAGSKIEAKKKEGPAQGDQREIPALTKKWLTQNPWFNQSNMEVESNAAKIISSQVHKEGIAVGTERHYIEVSRRLAKKFPDLKVKHLSGDLVARATRKRGGDGKKSTVDGGRSRGTKPTDKSEAKRLTDEDKATMRRFRLDPSDKEHVKEFLKSKVSTAGDKEE